MTRRNRKTDNSAHAEHVAKKARSEYGNDKGGKEKLNSDIGAVFEKFCREMSEYLSVEQMCQILETNGQKWTSSDHDAVVPKCLDMVYYGPLDNCPICGGNLECGRTITALELTASGQHLLKEHQDPKSLSKREQFGPRDKTFAGMTISLSGRLSQTQQRWKSDIEEHGGKVANSVLGITCLVPPSDRQLGSSSKVAEAMKNGIPVVSENWLIDSIKKQEVLPLDAYDVLSNPQNHEDKAPEYMAAEIKIFGKRGVYKDSKLEELGGKNRGKELNEFCVMQLIAVPAKHLHLYCKKGNVGNDSRAEILLVEWENVDDAIADFGRLFEELTGNNFEPWEREKKFEKKLQKFFPIDMADGYDVRYGGLGLHQLGIAATHCKLNPMVADLMKVLCSQEIYRYALTEMGMDAPDLPMGMLSDVHLQICEETLLEFVEKIKAMKVEGQRAMAVWSDFSQRWFILLHSTRPFIFQDFRDMADHAAASFENVRDIITASHLVAGTEPGIQTWGGEIVWKV